MFIFTLYTWKEDFLLLVVLFVVKRLGGEKACLLNSVSLFAGARNFFLEIFC
jgi:hypothetical protein